MSSKSSAGASHAERIARATGLIRALSGVLEATVESDAVGIRSIAVVAEPDQGVWEVTRNVQSALLASLGLTVQAAAVQVKLGQSVAERRPATQAEPERLAAAGQPQNGSASRGSPAPPAEGVSAGEGTRAPARRAVARNGKSAKAAVAGRDDRHSTGGQDHDPAADPGEVPASAPSAGAVAAESEGSRVAAEAIPRVVVEAPETEATQSSMGAAAGRKRLLRPVGGFPAVQSDNEVGAVIGQAQPLRRFTAEGSAIAEVAVPREEKHLVPGGAAIARLEIKAQPSGRIACRAVVASGDHIYAGHAAGADTPAGRLEVAARAVLAAALRPAELDAIRLVELAGRRYVVAAVRSWSGRETVYHADVAPVGASPEAAAARATLDAILQ